MSPRTVIISDTHLGRGRCAARSAAALRPLWDGASHLIVNGDVAEVHHPRRWAQAVCQLVQLRDLCEQDGVQLTLLSGNHDPNLSAIRHLHLAEGQVLVTHGDVLHPAIVPWSPNAARLRRAYEEAMSHLPAAERGGLEARLAAARFASHQHWNDSHARRSTVGGTIVRPHVWLSVLRYWNLFPRLAATLLMEHAPAARFILVGHTHWPGLWTFGRRVVVNTGCFGGFPRRPLAVVVDDASLQVVPVRTRQGEYRLSRQAMAGYSLAAAVARAAA